MRKASKIIMVIAIGATALTSFVGMASAENEVSIRYGDVTVDVGAFGTFSGDTVAVESRGTYESGFRYDLDIASVKLEGLETIELGSLDARYMMGAFGPAASYAFSDEISNGILGVGVGAEVQHGMVEGYGSFTSDVEEFMQAYRLKVGGRANVTDKVMITAEYINAYDGHGARGEGIEVGTRYTMVNDAYVDAKFTRNYNPADVEIDVVSVGLGFNF